MQGTGTPHLVIYEMQPTVGMSVLFVLRKNYSVKIFKTVRMGWVIRICQLRKSLGTDKEHLGFCNGKKAEKKLVYIFVYTV